MGQKALSGLSKTFWLSDPWFWRTATAPPRSALTVRLRASNLRVSDPASISYIPFEMYTASCNSLTIEGEKTKSMSALILSAAVAKSSTAPLAQAWPQLVTAGRSFHPAVRPHPLPGGPEYRIIAYLVFGRRVVHQDV